MQSWRRKSLWLALSASWLLLVLLGGLPLLRPAVPPRPRPGAPQGWPHWLDAELLQSFSQLGELLEDAPRPPRASHGSSCSWGTCFDTSKCRGDGLKVFVYPVTAAAASMSETHRRILASIEGSRYHSFSPTEACLYLLLSLDTPAGECGPVPSQWNGGKNHLILSLHPASCPRTVQLGQAMVAKASPTVDSFRSGFDVALPLLPEAHPLQGGVSGQLRQHSPLPGVALLALEEERGGWRTAGTNSSACLWGGHCEQDPGPELTQPRETLPNATFCLIFGKRPDASLRFLQALQAGCIPVLLSPRWELPFSEVIDWTKAAIIADERLLLQVPAALQEMSPARVLALRQQTQFLWDAYFSSVEKVIHTMLEIIQDRIFRTSAHLSLLWNSPPGALLALPTFSIIPQDFPFYHFQQGSRLEGRFSALIWVGAPGQPPLKLIQAVAGSQHCAQILVLWSNEQPLPSRWPETAVPLTVMNGHRKALRTLTDETPACVDILMNFLVAAVTKLPPIKLPYGKQQQKAAPPVRGPGAWGPKVRAKAPAPSPGLHQPDGSSVWPHAPGVLLLASGPGVVQGPGVGAAQEVPQPGEALGGPAEILGLLLGGGAPTCKFSLLPWDVREPIMTVTQTSGLALLANHSHGALRGGASSYCQAALGVAGLRCARRLPLGVSLGFPLAWNAVLCFCTQITSACVSDPSLLQRLA
ncbi:exostosin-like 1 isoform X4 [Nycticebus coucang]|uniref:exostosin-like 1 isoform X4 n=1 Tax=Nycticebus coucang TaxID=9470 RepID=UPI00234E3723|nr:exostosin-like 1 isoform X4 [Nycticebus coucang]